MSKYTRFIRYVTNRRSSHTRCILISYYLVLYMWIYLSITMWLFFNFRLTAWCWPAAASTSAPCSLPVSGRMQQLTLAASFLVQRCNGTTIGMGYLEVLEFSKQILILGQLASVRTVNSQWRRRIQLLYWHKSFYKLTIQLQCTQARSPHPADKTQSEMFSVNLLLINLNTVPICELKNKCQKRVTLATNINNKPFHISNCITQNFLSTYAAYLS